MAVICLCFLQYCGLQSHLKKTHLGCFDDSDTWGWIVLAYFLKWWTEPKMQNFQVSDNTPNRFHVSLFFEELGLVFCRNTLQSRDDKTEVLPGLEEMCFWLHFPTGGWCRSCSVQHVPRGLFDNKLTYAAKNRVKCRKEVTEKASLGDLCVLMYAIGFCSCSITLLWHVLFLCCCVRVEGHSEVMEGGNLFQTREQFSPACVDSCLDSRPSAISFFASVS